MKYLYTFILALFALQSFGQTLETDRLALVAFYNAGNGPNWFNSTGWTSPGVPGDSPCGWYGVTCEGGRVTKLVLEDTEIGPTLPAAIGGLSALKHLDLSGIGPEFPNFRGDIPAELGNLINLEYLDLSENMIYGPNIAVIGNLTNLKHLSITPYAAVPASFANLTNLQYLRMASEDYPMGSGAAVGAIPSFFGNLTWLHTLIMHNAGATGPIPPELEALPLLKVLDLSNNQLTGDIPFRQQGTWTNLEILDLSDNQLTGNIPPTFTNFLRLTKLDLSNNLLTWVVPSLFGIPVAATVNISNNKFTFAGIEENISRLDIYSDQAKIPLHANVIMGKIGGRVNGELAGGLFVYAGGTLANNTYRWYKNGALFTTTVGNEELWTDEGLYRVEVTNSLVPGLTLISEEYNLIRLPITLVSFDGKSENSQTKLTWKTTSETNNKGFEIERSADTRTFEKIGFVDGNGDTKEDKTYHFTDLQPFETSYYRLKQLDYDGKFEYSKVIAVRGNQVEIKVYPNPAQELLTISGAKSESDVRIYNNAGRLVMKQGLNANGQVDIKALSNGIYNVTIGGYSKKLLIQR